MTPKRGLITDTFKVVKKARRGGKRNKSPSPPKTGGTVFFSVCMCIFKSAICHCIPKLCILFKRL